MDNQAQPIYPQGQSPTPLSFGSQPPTVNTIGYTSAPPEADKAQKSSRKKTIVIILISILAVIFFGLFIWAFVNYSEARTDVNGQIDKAVALAVNQKATELETEFTEREKSPYSTFTGPEDYGYLTFQYPKTWSLYIAKDASSGGNYEAYLNPGAVNPVSNTTINALRVSIIDKAYDSEIKTYETRVKNGKMSVSVRLINGENANLYSGELTTGNLIGTAAIFPIRDKTVVLQTDANVFLDDFNHILDTVQYTK